MITFETFWENHERVQARVLEACAQAGREPAEVRVLPVTKNHPFDAIAYAERAGYAAVGENRVQEALDKMSAGQTTCRWELIGHLQSNKAKVVAERFDRVQSVDSEKLLRRLDAAAAEHGRRLSILLQVNAGDDPAKFGLKCAATPALLEVALGLAHIQIDGLMTIAPLSDQPAVAQRCFARMRDLRDELAAQFGVSLPELSMGMSGDLEAAVASGSTMLRIGSAFFGDG
ncbi:YggS family pyridoxal phosphate-dependent enzyme [Cerasicoccus arenae]|uniref:Pyridoxal phosphate homeostasis protein n=1 Tax=Cerasicoccus arenae TaxID=424488 RepID=A0A8J3D929_9BACT|nr:YggS family pyridoxal phosphate-dependent enzyme [Cerasicoccus arenae]MBK1856997.1 YggS family pyridoxal phosphate-dependent enzyme [Cerasicoccus arenae]GHB90302.1 YggS family pyridoxal phosphate enzyme [Cerasicoccus arenae]